MHIGGSANRIELKPETDEEKAALQRYLDGDGIVFWGDSDEFRGGAFVISTVPVPARPRQRLGMQWAVWAWLKQRVALA